ncbi:MAG: hypothetical protein BMS9Abin37_2643 [Acidobacteriota bacterium]|nr:MAG: hypothetical protein BMS9Abin37_2643 [Acidobacteriota bacterium]
MLQVLEVIEWGNWYLPEALGVFLIVMSPLYPS